MKGKKQQLKGLGGGYIYLDSLFIWNKMFYYSSLYNRQAKKQPDFDGILKQSVIFTVGGLLFSGFGFLTTENVLFILFYLLFIKYQSDGLLYIIYNIQYFHILCALTTLMLCCA